MLIWMMKKGKGGQTNRPCLGVEARIADLELALGSRRHDE